MRFDIKKSRFYKMSKKEEQLTPEPKKEVSDLGTYPEMFKSDGTYFRTDYQDPPVLNHSDTTKEELEEWNADLECAKEYKKYPQPFLEDVYFCRVFEGDVITTNETLKQFYEYFNDLEEMQKRLEEMNFKGQVYTEKEGETGGLWWDRGFHLVNRTGNYVILHDPKYRVMEYTHN